MLKTFVWSHSAVFEVDCEQEMSPEVTACVCVSCHLVSTSRLACLVKLLPTCHFPHGAPVSLQCSPANWSKPRLVTALLPTFSDFPWPLGSILNLPGLKARLWFNPWLWSSLVLSVSQPQKTPSSPFQGLLWLSPGCSLCSSCSLYLELSLASSGKPPWSSSH